MHERSNMPTSSGEIEYEPLLRFSCHRQEFFSSSESAGLGFLYSDLITLKGSLLVLS